jgi:hypothetical protein
VVLVVLPSPPKIVTATRIKPKTSSPPSTQAALPARSGRWPGSDEGGGWR